MARAYLEDHEDAHGRAARLLHRRGGRARIPCDSAAHADDPRGKCREAWHRSEGRAATRTDRCVALRGNGESRRAEVIDDGARTAAARWDRDSDSPMCASDCARSTATARRLVLESRRDRGHRGAPRDSHMSTPVTAVIADDEPLLRASLRAALAEAWPDLEIVAEAANGADALHAVREHGPQLVFLDIEMPVMNGLVAARELRGAAHVVFVTAYDRYAVEAFDRGAVDYVLKPVSVERLADTVARLKERLRETPGVARKPHRGSVTAHRTRVCAIAMGTGFARQHHPPHQRRRRGVLPVGHEVHPRGHRRCRGAGEDAAARAGGRNSTRAISGRCIDPRS